MNPIANMLVQIKNAQAAGAASVAVPFSNLKYNIAQMLKAHGFVTAVDKKKKKMNTAELPYLEITLKYDGREGAIGGIKLVSKSSRRMYAGKNDLYPVRSGFGFSVISTSKGLMTNTEARKAGMGGEVLFEIW